MKQEEMVTHDRNSFVYDWYWEASAAGWAEIN